MPQEEVHRVCVCVYVCVWVCGSTRQVAKLQSFAVLLDGPDLLPKAEKCRDVFLAFSLVFCARFSPSRCFSGRSIS